MNTNKQLATDMIDMPVPALICTHWRPSSAFQSVGMVWVFFVP